jgi:hypothetical protein
MSASSTTAPVIRASAGAIARLAKALVTWKMEESSFTYHMSTLQEGQDRAFWDAMEVLHTVAHNVDEAYRTWQGLERDFGKDYTNIYEHVRLAIANAVVS